MNVIIYTRQSKHRDESVTHELQENACQTYARGKGWDVVQVLNERGLSGRTIAKRTEFQTAVQMIKSGEAEMLLVWRWSRFARNTLDGLITLQTIEKEAGGRVECALEQVDRSAMGKFSLTMMLGMAELESNVKGEQWNEALMFRFSKGIPPSGKVQYGYDKVSGSYVQNPEQAGILQEAYERYTAGEGARLICDDFNRRGLPSAGSAGWYPNGLFDLLDKPFYGGQIVWKPTKDAEALITKGAHKPILEAAQWAAYQKAREERKTHAKPRNPKWFASGIVRCGLCEAPMVSARDSRGVDNLACSTYNNQGKTGCIGVRRKRSIVSFKIHMWLNTHYEEWAAGMPTDDEAKLTAEKALTDAEEALNAATEDYSAYATFAFEHKLLPAVAATELAKRAEAIATAEKVWGNALAALGTFEFSETPEKRIDEGLLLMGFTEGEADEPSPEATARFRQALAGVIEKVLVMPQSTKAARDPKRNLYDEVVIVPRS